MTCPSFQQVKLLAVATGLIVICTGASALAQSQQQTPRPGETLRQQSQATGAQQQPATDPRGTDQSPLTVKVQPAPKTDEETAKEQAKEQRESDANWWAMVAVIATFVVGVLQLGAIGFQVYIACRQNQIIGRQSKIMTRQRIAADRQTKHMASGLNQAALATAAATRSAESAEQALAASSAMARKQLRSYIAVLSSRLVARPTVGAKIGIETVLQNTGQTPALNLQVSNKFDLFTAQQCQTLDTTIAGRLHIGSGLRRVVQVYGGRGLTKDEVDKIEAGSLVICYAGRFTYDDVFGETHITEACAYYHPEPSDTSGGIGDLFLSACSQPETLT